MCTLLLTYFTDIRCLSRMNQHMCLKIATSCKLFAADTTNKSGHSSIRLIKADSKEMSLLSFWSIMKFTSVPCPLSSFCFSSAILMKLLALSFLKLLSYMK